MKNMRKEEAMAKTVCKILGVVSILIGVIGLFAHDLLGMHMTLAHNLFHLLTGGLALYYGFTGTNEAAHIFSWIIGAIYLLVGVLGFITPGLIERILRVNSSVMSVSLMPENIVHLLIGAIFLIAGVLSEPQPVAPTAAKPG